MATLRLGEVKATHTWLHRDCRSGLGPLGEGRGEGAGLLRPPGRDSVTKGLGPVLKKNPWYLSLQGRSWNEKSHTG